MGKQQWQPRALINRSANGQRQHKEGIELTGRSTEMGTAALCMSGEGADCSHNSVLVTQVFMFEMQQVAVKASFPPSFVWSASKTFIHIFITYSYTFSHTWIIFAFLANFRSNFKQSSMSQNICCISALVLFCFHKYVKHLFFFSQILTHKCIHQVGFSYVAS